MDLTSLNSIFAKTPLQGRLPKLFDYFEEREVMLTSSFGTSSAILLHLLSEAKPEFPVHFINTSYLFPQTLAYKDHLIEKLGLKVIEVHPHPANQRLTQQNKTWEKDSDFCCTVNKVMPLEEITSHRKLWITGLMGHQSPGRKRLESFDDNGNILKFHPLIDFPIGKISSYFKVHALPLHPLEPQGYGSVGCTHCTIKGVGRKGRWYGQSKTECGLHNLNTKAG